MRHAKTVKRQVTGDPIHSSKLITKLVNKIMQDGKKTVAQNLVYKALDIIAEKEKTDDPLSVFERALQNVGPKVEVKARRVGGASYQVPTEVRGDRKVALAINWVIDAARKRSSKDFHLFEQKLAQEILDASKNLGDAIKKRDSILRTAEANRAFSHFRW